VDDGCALLPCEGCQRHVRCGERVCPFCGARQTPCLALHEFRIESRLPRGLVFSIGAALATAGFAVSCGTSEPVYGATPGDYPRAAGGTAGEAGDGGQSGDDEGGSGGG